MKKSVLIFIVLCINTIVYSQDWCGWAFEYNFEVKNKYSYRLDSLNIYLNEPFSNSKFRNGKLKYNESTSSYSVLLTYGSICTGNDELTKPPTIFIQFFIYNDFYNQKYSIVIPINFEEQDKNELKFKNIDILDNSTQIEEYNPVQFNFGAIDYASFIEDGFIGIIINDKGLRENYKIGEYGFPIPNKLLKIE